MAQAAKGVGCSKFSLNIKYSYFKTGLKASHTRCIVFNPLNAELNPICHLLALLGAHPILHVSRIRVKWDGGKA